MMHSPLFRIHPPNKITPSHKRSNVLLRRMLSPHSHNDNGMAVEKGRNVVPSHKAIAHCNISTKIKFVYLFEANLFNKSVNVTRGLVLRILVLRIWSWSRLVLLYLLKSSKWNVIAIDKTKQTTGVTVFHALENSIASNSLLSRFHPSSSRPLNTISCTKRVCNNINDLIKFVDVN